jgi:hypothetical protein
MGFNIINSEKGVLGIFKNGQKNKILLVKERLNKQLSCIFTEGGRFNVNITNDLISLKAGYVEEYLTAYTFIVSSGLALWLILLLCGLGIILTGIIIAVICIRKTKAKNQMRNAQLL